MTAFITGGPPRYHHQRDALAKILETGGKCALLMEPGTGKTPVAIDYACTLALRYDRPVRVLVAAPLAAVDSWISAMEGFASPHVDFWAEALTGDDLTLPQRAEALAARGGSPFPRSPSPKAIPQRSGTLPSALHHHLSLALATRTTRSDVEMSYDPRLGPDGMNPSRPRLIVEVLNYDTFRSGERKRGKTRALMVESVLRFAPDLLICDECVPAGTMIPTPSGEVPIESLRKGDEVLTFNHERGVVEVDTVLETMIRQTTTPLVRVRDTFMTPEHPVWTEEDGYVPAGLVRAGQTVVVTYYETRESPEGMRVVRERLHPAPAQQEGDGEVLQRPMLHPVPGSTARVAREDAREGLGEPGVAGGPEGAVRGDSPNSRVQEEDGGVPPLGAESIQGPRDTGEVHLGEPGQRVCPPKWREREGGYHSRTPPVGSPRMAAARSGGFERWGAADALRTGLGERDPETGRGSGWKEPPDPEGAGVGSAQRGAADTAGLDDPQVHQRAGVEGPPARVGGDRQTVYNLTTGNSNYFANGLLVHNCHLLRNPASNLSKAMNDISDWVDRRLLLTGTATPRGVVDILGQWRVIDPFAFAERTKDGALRRMSHDAFMRRYDGWWGKGNRAELESIMAKNSIVVRKADALDLPPTMDIRVPFDLSGPEQRAYRDLIHRLATMLRGGELVDAQNRLVQLLRLRQLTSGYLPDDTGKIHRVGTSKVDAVRSLVQDTLAGEKRIVVFAYFRAEIDQIAAAVADDQTTVVTITGSTEKPERIRLRKWFGSDDPQRIVLVAQIRTLNLAVNELVTASHAIFASMSLDRSEYIQARDRLDRIGQTRPVSFWLMLARNTVDETILAAHDQRTDAEEALLKAIMAADATTV